MEMEKLINTSLPDQWDLDLGGIRFLILFWRQIAY